jgi:RNA-binding protein
MLTSKERSRLAGIAQTRQDLVQLGKAGLTPALLAQLARLLDSHELVKLRFVGFKEGREELARDLARDTGSELVRVIGNTAVFWKRNADPEMRRIQLD